jgi:hypothetical protein
MWAAQAPALFIPVAGEFMKMKKILVLFSGLVILGVLPQPLSATPSTHVWTPSTDIQANRTFHLTSDLYVPSQKDVSGSKPDTVTNLGLETGLWPIKDKLGVELGFDSISGYGQLDSYPLYFNAKAGTPENVFFDGAPALAVGGYYFGTKHNKTDQNVYYVEGAKSLTLKDFSVGRFSAGWYWGNDKLLLDENSDTDADGVILAWERTISEISDKLWLCVDYQGGHNGNGALAPGFAWKFADNVSVIFGYVIPNNKDLAQTFTVQLDVDFGNY